MFSKKEQRVRRTRKTRGRISSLKQVRLCVHKTPRHIYAQIIAPEGGKVLVSVSSLDRELQGKLKYGGNIDAAEQVGKMLALRAQDAGIQKVAFDRSGFHYHGRLKALADAARANGMEF